METILVWEIVDSKYALVQKVYWEWFAISVTWRAEQAAKLKALQDARQPSRQLRCEVCGASLREVK